MTDYRVYVLTTREKVQYFIMAAAFLCFMGLIFFNSLLIGLLAACGAVFYLPERQRHLGALRREQLNLQFKDALYYLASALSAGRSLENSLRATLQDLQVMYGDNDCLIIKELTHICQRLELNEPLEICLQDLAQRSGLEDILHFSQVIAICRRSGGNLVDVVRKTSAVLSEKIEISQDIQLQLTKQKFEQKILNLMPFVFIALLKLGGGGYLDVLYTSVAGYLCIGIALLLLGAAWMSSKAILDIRV